MHIKYPDFVARTVRAISVPLAGLCDIFIDILLTGQSLGRIVEPSLFYKAHGATGTESTNYLFLNYVLKGMKFTENDSFIDVGCGHGRILAYLKHKRFPGQLCGVEINPDVAIHTKKWTSRHDNIKIIQDDIFNVNIDEYNIFCLARPLSPDSFFLKFVEKLEAQLTHPITLIYLFEQESGYLLHNRIGWKETRWEYYDRKYGFYVIKWPQCFSIWSYDPQQKE